jgi:prepilin-type N-terminal cleavage/methylation domain-containing protein
MNMDGRAEESGFTLVELLVAMSISGLILGAIVTATYVGLRTTSNGRLGLDQSNAEQLISAWFNSDVQSSCDPSQTSPTCTRTPNPSSSSTSACGSNALFADDVVSSPNSSAADQTIAYVVQGSNLTRLTCAVGGSSPTSTTVLTSNLKTASVSYPSSGACAGQFQLAVTLSGSSLGNGTSDYSFTLCAQRRA